MKDELNKNLSKILEIDDVEYTETSDNTFDTDTYQNLFQKDPETVDELMESLSNVGDNIQQTEDVITKLDNDDIRITMQNVGINPDRKHMFQAKTKKQRIKKDEAFKKINETIEKEHREYEEKDPLKLKGTIPVDDVDSQETSLITTQENAIVVDPQSIDAETEFARRNIKKLLKTGEKAVDQLAFIAETSQHPRAYEVMSGLMKNMSDLNKDLLNIQKLRKEISDSHSNSTNGGMNIDKAVVFSGTSADLLKMLKGDPDDSK